jgi:aminopeptidase-like protein
MNLRDEFAARIMAGICAGDWRFDIPDGKTWTEIAVARAYEIADAMIKEGKVETVMDFTQHNRIMNDIYPDSHWKNLPKDTDK